MNIFGIQRQAETIMKKSPSQLRQQYKGKKLSPIIYNILEENNWHTENSILSEIGAFGKPLKKSNKYAKTTYYTPRKRVYMQGSKDYKEYRQMGGKGLL